MLPLIYHFIFLVTIFILSIITSGLVTARHIPTPSPSVPISSSCPNDLQVGYQVVEFTPGRKMAVWYPTTDSETDYQYDGNITGHISENGSVNTCRRWPLVVFSHGYTGCGIESLFFTEALARNGYIVAAPDHNDHGCSIAENKTLSQRNSPDKWGDQLNTERRNDIETSVNYLTTSGSKFVDAIDQTNIGLIGYSLGGHTMFGIANDLPDWKGKHIKAALLFSPYLFPYLADNSLGKISIPVMYQGAANDYTTNALLDGPKGVYSQTNSAKYFLILAKGDHFDWNNSICQNETILKDCLEKNQTVRTINTYGIAFLDRYLKEKPSSILESTASALIKYQYSP